MFDVERGFTGFSYNERFGLLSGDVSPDALIAWATWILHTVPVYAQERDDLRSVLRDGLNDSTSQRTYDILIHRIQSFESDLRQGIGISFSNYQLFVSGLIYGDHNALDYVVRISEESMKRDPNDNLHTGKDVYVTSKLKNIKDKYIRTYIAHIPRTDNPKQEIIHAEPGKGKTEFKKTHLSGIEHTHAICDVDHAREFISRELYDGTYDETNQQLLEQLRGPSYYVVDAVTSYAHAHNLNLFMESNLARGEYWLDPNNPVVQAAKSGWETTVHELVRPEYHSFVRASMRRRKVAPKDFLFALGGLHNVVPFAITTNATVHLHDFSHTIHEKTGFVSPYFAMRQGDFIKSLYDSLPEERIILPNSYPEELDIFGSVLDL